jgi:hypothetical protein
VSGTLGVTGIATFTDDIIIGDGKTIGSASDIDAITIASNGQVTLTQTLIGTALDISGNIDIDGTANLDVVDIDGAVDMATTLQVDGSITSSDGMVITTADNTDTLKLISTDEDANAGPNLRMYRNSDNPADNDVLGITIYTGRNDNSQDVIYAKQLSYIKDASDGTEDGQYTLQTMVAGTVRDRLNINPTEIVLNEDSQDLDFRVETDGDPHAFFVEGSTNNLCVGAANATRHSQISKLLVLSESGTTGHFALHVGRTGTGTVGLTVFSNGNGKTGSITTNNTATVYNTSSDYRLKENVSYDFDATTRLKQLKPARFNWITDDTNTLIDGFLAHEVSSIVPEAITGEKDAVYSDGNIDPQGIDQSKLVPLLVKTIQELEARIKALEDA